MELSAATLRHLPVRHVPHEDVLERVLLVVGDRRCLEVRDEVTALELRQARSRILTSRPFLCPEMCDRTGPEDGTDHSRMVGELLFLYCQPIEAGANQPLHARRNGDVAHLLALPALEFEQPLLAQHPHRLLDEERVAARVGDQARGEPRLGERGVAGEIRQESGSLIGPERLQLDCAPPAFPTQEARRFVLEFRACRPDEQERHVGLLAENVRHQLQQRRLGPVKVLDNDCRRLLAREDLQCAPDAPVQLGLRDLARRVGPARGRRDANQVREG